MPHKRSLEALERLIQKRKEIIEQRRKAKQIVVSSAFMDREKAESVNLLSPQQILIKLTEDYPEVHVRAVHFTQGEVLIDSRGEGSLNKISR